MNFPINAKFMAACSLIVSLLVGRVSAQSNPSPLPPETKGKVEAGMNHTLALTAEGILWSWGSNFYGQVGDRTTVHRNAPVHIILGPYSGTTFKSISANDHSAAIDTADRLWCWGRNHHGQLGDGTAVNNATPRVVEMGPPGNAAKSVACGYTHTVAADTSGRVWAWGNNSSGQLGIGSYVSSSVPVETPRVTGMGLVIQVAAGNGCSYALDSAGKIWAWGSNTNGQLGDGTTATRTTPVQVAGTSLPTFRFISAKSAHVAALGYDDTVWTWGYNGYGQLGHGDYVQRTQPVRVTGMSLARNVSAGANHTLAESESHNVWGWGSNAQGRIGDGTTTNRTSPVAASTSTGLVNAVSVAAGGNHSVALRHGGILNAWGLNLYGQLGTGSTSSTSLPSALTALKLGNDDSDVDLLPDSWEKFYFANLTKTNTADTDLDTLSERNEYLNGTSPSNADTDGDGIPDGLEITWGFLPLDASDGAKDHDGDGWSNYMEIMVLGTDPKSYTASMDNDGDGLNDLWEIAHGLNPASSTGNDGASGDPDGDGALNSTEYANGTDPSKRDHPAVKLNVTVFGN